MDITSRKNELQTNTDVQIPANEKLKKQSKTESTQENNNINVDHVEDEHPKVLELQKITKNHARYLQTALQKQQIFGDPKPMRLLENDDHGLKIVHQIQHSEQKSAFTKVNLVSKESRASPSLSASPDINYQNSLSPSPPILNRSYQLHANMLSPNQIFKPAYQNNFMQENFVSPTNPMMLENPFLTKNSSDLLQPNFANKMRPILGQYRHELSYNYPQFQPPDMLKISQPDLKFPEIRNPAAAILSTLLPPSLAALSLPAQNICAKCNVSFRMTSDLVYHMRSHHKNDTVDMTKKRREEKLKCPVCAESFRERHHLTRHMTAHQDKEDDDEDPVAKKKDFANFSK
ncbi:hypothetical protein FQR65_LT08350 [Abscondita terminalis]|nr:hypothetical protein FQR65_LT08350 [Abscondita terminalis]